MTQEEKRELITKVIESNNLELMKKTLDELDFSGLNLNIPELSDAVLKDIVVGSDHLTNRYGVAGTERLIKAKDDIDRWIEEAENLNERDIEDVMEVKRFVDGHLDAYSYILSDGLDGKGSALASVKNYSIGQIETLLEDLHKKIFITSPGYSAGSVRSKYNEIRVGYHFYTPNNDSFDQTKEKPLRRVQDVLRHKDVYSNSKYIDEAVKAYYTVYTQQYFHNGNSRNSKVFLNFLLSAKNIPFSFAAANGFDLEREIARDTLGYDQRIRHHQLSGDYQMKDKDGREIIQIVKKDEFGNPYYEDDGRAIKILVYKDNGEVFEDKKAGIKGNWYNVLFNMDPIIVPAGMDKTLQHKMEGSYGWQPLRDVDYTPMQRVVYKSILTTYLNLYLDKDGKVKGDNPQEVSKHM